MATVNLGSIKFKWKGTYAGGTAYTIDDVVSYNGSSYICIQASTGNLPTDTAYFEQMSQKGTDADLLSIASTAQGDIYYNNGGAIARLGAGTSGQALITGGTGANPSWGTISSGTYSVHRIDSYSYDTEITASSQTDYIDISGGNTVNFTPTSTDDQIFFTHLSGLNWNNYAQGADVYLMMKAGSSAIGSGDTKLNYRGQHSSYINQVADFYTQVTKAIVLPCTNLTVGTTYYVEQAGGMHVGGQDVVFNKDATGGSAFVSGTDLHHVTMTHYKKN